MPVDTWEDLVEVYCAIIDGTADEADVASRRINEYALANNLPVCDLFDELHQEYYLRYA